MKYIEETGDITKGDAATKLGLKSYDTALPQRWVDHFVETLRRDNFSLIKEDLYGQIVSAFVWSYDNSLMGFPRPLTKKAHDFLKRYDELEHTHYADSTTEVLWLR